jgi:hypothetical protein
LRNGFLPSKRSGTSWGEVKLQKSLLFSLFGDFAKCAESVSSLRDPTVTVLCSARSRGSVSLAVKFRDDDDDDDGTKRFNVKHVKHQFKVSEVK